MAEQEKNETPQSNPVFDMETFKRDIKAQLLEEIKSDSVKAQEALDRRREEDKKAQQQYVERMMASAEPWVQVLAIVETEKGFKVQLDFNEAFVSYLKENGIVSTTGNPDDTVNKWLALLLRDVSDDIEGKATEKSTGEFI